MIWGLTRHGVDHAIEIFVAFVGGTFKGQILLNSEAVRLASWRKGHDMLLMSSGPYGLLKRLYNPLGHVFTSLLGRQNDFAMLLRRQPNGKPPREGLVWRFLAL